MHNLNGQGFKRSTGSELTCCPDLDFGILRPSPFLGMGYTVWEMVNIDTDMDLAYDYY